MKRIARLLVWTTFLLGLLPAGAATDDQPAPPIEGTAPPAEAAPPDRLHDYIDQVRAQRRAQIEQLRAESREDSERVWQQHRESLAEQSRARREEVERWRELSVPPGPPVAPGDWNNPWYYRGW